MQFLYPSITEDLFSKALPFVSHFTKIPTKHQEIISHTNTSILISNTEQWAKKHDSNFDVTMGSYYNAKTCQLIGIYLLNLY